MTISKRTFGTLPDGTQVSAWTLTNENGLQAEVLDYGVIIRSVTVPDKNGNPVDVVLGYDTLEEYVADDCYLGATVGRVANRIKGASFSLNGKTYTLYANNGPNHLHGGKQGFNKRIWFGEQIGNALVFSRISADGEEGYPGNLNTSVTYRFDEQGRIEITHTAISDKDTILGYTNHTYWCIGGMGKNIYDQQLQIFGDHYVETDAELIPTGQILSVAGTP